MGNTMAARKPPPTKWVSCQCIPQTACGTLSFEITGYLLHKGLGIGRFLMSTSIQAPIGYAVTDRLSAAVTGIK
ncbi:hypothetical protein EJB05_08997, partial [Eragrostis curvula]